MKNSLHGLHLARVEEVYPDAPPSIPEQGPPAYAGSVGVRLESLVPLVGTNEAPIYRIRILHKDAGPEHGEWFLPKPGTFGLVAFYANDAASGVWLGALDANVMQMVPEELLKQDPRAHIEQTPGGAYSIQHGDGTLEQVWPDGTLLKATVRKDGSFGNPGHRDKKTRRRKRVRDGKGWASKREEWSANQAPPVDVVLKHSSGAEVRISADGSFWLTTPQNHRLRLYDNLEKARDPQSGAVTAVEGEGERTASCIALESEAGHKVMLWDDPVKAVDRRITVESASGHHIVMQDVLISGSNTQKYIEVLSKGGHVLRMMDEESSPGLFRQYTRVDTLGGHHFVMMDIEVLGGVTFRYLRSFADEGYGVWHEYLPASERRSYMQSASGHTVLLDERPAQNKLLVQSAAGHKVLLDDILQKIRLEHKDLVAYLDLTAGVAMLDAPIIRLGGPAAVVPIMLSTLTPSTKVFAI